MTKEEYGELYKYLGMLRVSIMKLQDKEREYDFYKEEERAIMILLDAIPIIEDYIRN